jgi:hypothetical protein
MLSRVPELASSWPRWSSLARQAQRPAQAEKGSSAVPLACRYPDQSKLDCLAHNVAFISNLMESGIEFTAVDFPRLSMHGLR